MTWTQFHDMHPGGGQKLDWGQIFIEAPEAEARAAFERLFGRDPDHVTCSCCGEDYSISEEATLEQATGYERGCRFVGDVGYVEAPGGGGRPYQTLAEYRARPDVKIVTAAELAAGRS